MDSGFAVLGAKIDGGGGLGKRKGEEKEYGRKGTILYGSTVPIKIKSESRKKRNEEEKKEK